MSWDVYVRRGPALITSFWVFMWLFTWQRGIHMTIKEWKNTLTAFCFVLYCALWIISLLLEITVVWFNWLDWLLWHYLDKEGYIILTSSLKSCITIHCKNDIKKKKASVRSVGLLWGIKYPGLNSQVQPEYSKRTNEICALLGAHLINSSIAFKHALRCCL